MPNFPFGKNLPPGESEPQLTPTQSVFGYAALYKKKDAVTDYTLTEQRYRLQPHAIKPHEAGAFYRRFFDDPKDVQAYCRVNLMGVIHDPQMPDQEERKDRLRRYINEYLDLIIKSDHRNYPANPKVVHRHVPEYVPDGLSDMGEDDEINPWARSREKIRVNKAEMFKTAKPLLYEIFSMNFAKPRIVERVASFVHDNIKYGNNRKTKVPEVRSKLLEEYMEEGMGVCRHHALYTQVLLQALGITSRLVKCNMGNPPFPLGKHACNLVRIDGIWFLLDVTNPRESTPVLPSRNFLTRLSDENQRQIAQEGLDLNGKKYQWDIPFEGRTRRYETRNTMHYRIMENS